VPLREFLLYPKSVLAAEDIAARDCKRIAGDSRGLALRWGVTAALRRIPAVARVI
jgi:hypothetical protein